MKINRPDFSDTFNVGNYKGVKFAIVRYKPQYVIIDKNGKPIHDFNSKKEMKNHIDKSNKKGK